MFEDGYMPFDFNHPIEAALFQKLGKVVSDDRSRLGEWGPHCWRVSLLTAILAGEYGRPIDQCVDYGVAAYLHDLGKMDPEIAHLFRLERIFTPEERALADKHGYLGALMARQIFGDTYDPRKMRLVITGHLTHHIHYEGGLLNSLATALIFNESEPRFLAGKTIPRIGRIIHVVDSFDTIISKRPYKEAMPVGYACAELRKFSGKFYDPAIVETFISKVIPRLHAKSRRMIPSLEANRLAT